MWTHIHLLLVCACAVSASAENKGSKSGPLDGIISKVLENLRPDVANIKIPHANFLTGQQEFGNFTVTVDDVLVSKADEFEIVELDTTLLAIKNLTLRFDTVVATGKYDIDGMLIFPLGSNDIHIYGKDDMSVILQNLTVIVSAKVASTGGVIYVQSLDVDLYLGGLKVDFKNLNGGGDISDVLNQLVSDLGPTVVDYYKESILVALKPAMINIVNNIICCTLKNPCCKSGSLVF